MWMKANLQESATDLEEIAEDAITFPAMVSHLRRLAAHLRRLAEACDRPLTGFTREELGTIKDAMRASERLIDADCNLKERLLDAMTRADAHEISELGNARFWGIVGGWAADYPDLAKVED